MSKIILTTGAAAATPATGTIALYSKTDKKVYFKDDTGTEEELSIPAGADLLAALLPVDGSGSLLDADFLDGLDSTDFATAAQGTTADNALQNIIEDVTPQLGGNLDNNGFSITTDGNVVLSFTSGGENAVNWVDIQHETTGLAPIISVKGPDTNIDLKLDTKGTGDIDASTNKIVNVTDPTLAQDAATKNYVDTEVTTVSPAFRTVPGPITILPTDKIVVLSSGGPAQAVALLPVGAVPPGTVFTLKNGIGTSASIITPSGGDTIDGVGGSNAGLLVAPFAFTRLISNGASIWYVA